MRLKCECCGFEADLEPNAAYQAGWDAPPYFTMVTTCPLCPSAHVLHGDTWRHAAAHAQWERTGRPAEFDAESIDQSPEMPPHMRN